MKNLFLLLNLFFSCLNEKNDKPNIILFMVDDLGWQDVSVPKSGLKKQIYIYNLIWKN